VLGVAVIAAGRDFRATRGRVPRRIGPADMRLHDGHWSSLRSRRNVDHHQQTVYCTPLLHGRQRPTPRLARPRGQAGRASSVQCFFCEVLDRALASALAFSRAASILALSGLGGLGPRGPNATVPFFALAGFGGLGAGSAFCTWPVPAASSTSLMRRAKSSAFSVSAAFSAPLAFLAASMWRVAHGLLPGRVRAVDRVGGCSVCS